MKIEHPGSNVEATSRVGVETGRGPVKPAAATGTDAVHLSGDLQLAERAVRAASADGGKPDAVARLSALHAKGELGVNVEQLADRMIDALIHSDGEYS